MAAIVVSWVHAGCVSNRLPPEYRNAQVVSWGSEYESLVAEGKVSHFDWITRSDPNAPIVYILYRPGSDAYYILKYPADVSESVDIRIEADLQMGKWLIDTKDNPVFDDYLRQHQNAK